MAARSVTRSSGPVSATKSDARAAAFLAIGLGDEALRGRVKEALAGEPWAQDMARIGAVARELVGLGRDAATAQARMIDAGRLPIEHLPRGVDPAYVAAKAPEDRVAPLIEAGVIRPDATVREIREAIHPPRVAGSDDGGPLTPGQRRVLEHRAARPEAELARIRRRLEKP